MARGVDAGPQSSLTERAVSLGMFQLILAVLSRARNRGYYHPYYGLT